MKKRLVNAMAILVILFSNTLQAKEKLTLILDWFVNPDHAAIIVAQQKGFFDKNGLEVEIIEPADPSMPPKLVATGEADLAVDYQPQFHIGVDQGLPLVRVGTLVSTPLNSVTILADSGIKDLSDLKGKKVGYSVSGFEDTLLDVMFESVGLSSKDVELINVNWSLSPSLFSGQVDAVIGSYRNFELNQMDIENRPGKAFYPEEHGVPNYDELIVVAQKENYSKEKISAFLTALEQATTYLINHSEEGWEAFVSYKPQELDNELNRRAWRDTLPRLALRPRALDNARYQKMAEFMQQKGVIKSVPTLADYAIQVE